MIVDNRDLFEEMTGADSTDMPAVVAFSTWTHSAANPKVRVATTNDKQSGEAILRWVTAYTLPGN